MTKALREHDATLLALRSANVDRCDLYDEIGYGSSAVLDALPERP